VLQLRLQPVDLVELARQRCEHLHGIAQAHEVELRVSSLANLTVRADPDRLAQALDNLLDNAIRYSPPGSQVEVCLEQQGEEITCMVRDQGCGISPEHLPLIFERFYRADAARDRSHGGSGLGLAIVHDLVQAHGGRVSASSAPGHGTTITFWLPALPASS
jgi:signal transduction histidine kinase